MIRAAAALFAVALLAAGCGRDAPHLAAAPARLALADFAGAPATLDLRRGRPMLVNVWASWCGPCRAEMPAFECLHASAGDAVAVVGISVDADRHLAAEFLRDHRVSFGNFSDAEGRVTREQLGVGVLPLTLVIAADGTVLARVAGARDWRDPAVLARYGIALDAAAIGPACSPARSA
jgi:thiol-disulfide isomerase/thioredoxin